MVAAAAANGKLAAAAAESDDDRVFVRICVVWHKQLRRFLEVPKTCAENPLLFLLSFSQLKTGNKIRFFRRIPFSPLKIPVTVCVCV